MVSVGFRFNYSRIKTCSKTLTTYMVGSWLASLSSIRYRLSFLWLVDRTFILPTDRSTNQREEYKFDRPIRRTIAHSLNWPINEVYLRNSSASQLFLSNRYCPKPTLSPFLKPGFLYHICRVFISWWCPTQIPSKSWVGYFLGKNILKTVWTSSMVIRV